MANQERIGYYMNVRDKLASAAREARDAGDFQLYMVLSDDAAWAFGEIWFRRFGESGTEVWS